MIIIIGLFDFNSCDNTLQRGLPQWVHLWLLLGAVNLTTPAVSNGPRLVGLHWQQGLVPGLRGPTQGGDHRHVQVAGLVGGRRVALIKELLSPAGELFSGYRGVHVFVRIRRGLRLDACVGHPTRVVTAAKVSIGQRRVGRALGG